MHNKKVFFLTGFWLVISFVMTALVAMETLKQVVDPYEKELTLSVISQIYNDIGIELNNPIVASRTMANDYFLETYLADPDFPSTPYEEEILVSYLENIREGFGYNTAFVVSGANGKYYTMNGFNKIIDPVNDEHDVWYSTFVNSNLEYDFDVDVDEVNNNAWSVFVNCRVENSEGELLGVCGVGIDMTYLQDILKNYEEKYDVRVNLVDENGLVQIDTDMINIENAILEEAVAQFSNDQETSYFQPDEGGYVCTKYIENFDWYLVVSSENNLDNISNNLFMNLSASFLLILVLLLFSTFVVIYKDRIKLESQSTTDPMTGLFNKKYFITSVMKDLKKKNSFPCGLMFVDMDHFKSVNDELGHSKGDEAILKMAEVLRSIFRENDYIARFGGDEFVIFLRNIPEQSLITRLNAIHKEAHLTFENEGKYVSISASVGAVYCTSPEMNDFDTLINIADEELYKVKEQGRDNFSLRKV